MADSGNGVAVVGTPDTVKEGGTPMEITPSRRSSRKKQSTFSDDFEYYTPTGRKKEEDKKISPQQTPKGNQKKASQNDIDSEEEKNEKASNKLSKKKVGQKKQKGKSEGDIDESDEDEVQKPKPKVGKGKLKMVAKKSGIKKSASLKKKSAVQKQKVSSGEDDEDDDMEEDDESEETSGEESEEIISGKKRKATGLSKKQPGKIGMAGRKKKKVEEKYEDQEESSSDEEDSTPISQLQAQLKQKKADTKVFRESPLAQNLEKKLLEVGAESSTSVEGEEGASSTTTVGQKRKVGEDIEEASPAKKTAKVSQFQNLGSALASLVKRIPPSDLGLVKRTPNEMAAKVSKQGMVSNATVKENDTDSTEKIKSVSIEESKPIEIIASKHLTSTLEDTASVDKVKQENDASEKKPNINIDKRKTVKFDSESFSSNKTPVKSERDKMKGSDVLMKKKVKLEEKQAKDQQSKTVLTKDGKASVLISGHKTGKESLLKRETSIGKQNQSQKLSESELRQKKIEQIKAKIAEKSAGQKPFLEKQGQSKPSDSSSGKPVIKKESLKESEMRKKKQEQIKAKVEVSSKKFFNLPSHLLKKKLEVKGYGKSNDDIIKRGIVLKKKSHQPFGNKNVVKKLSEKSSNSKNKSDANDEEEKERKIERDKNKKLKERRRKSSEGEKKKSLETKAERQLSNDGNKKQSKSSEKQRKSSTGEDSGSKEINKGTNEPPLLTPAGAAVPTKANKHKHHKPEHDVPIDMSMMDLFKPDGLIVHDPATTAATTSESNSQSESIQIASSSTNSGFVRPEHVHHVLLEHQYSKTSAAADSLDENERGLCASGAYHQKSATVTSGKDDVESMSHNNSVIMDASLPEQILQESSEELVTSTQDEAADGNDEGRQEGAGNRTSILESLNTELKESGTDFLIVGQVEVSRQTSEVASTSSSSASTQKSPGPSEGKKGSEILPSASPDTRKRKDSDRSSGSRKKSADSQGSAADKKKSTSLLKNDQKKKKADIKGKGKDKDKAAEIVLESGEEDEEFEDDENDFDWEDPDMLYCLCRKPHNNRFMICCDKCEEWYHGTCVGITRARGKEMEDNEEEYTCPICIKGDGISVLEKAPVSSKSTEMSSPAPKLLQKCVGRKCNKTPRPGSVYCSNECIMNHAQESLKAIRDEQAKKTSKEKHHSSQESSGKSSSSKVPPSPSSSSDVVEVMERESGKILRGPSAPTQKGLHRWLEQHPSFEVVQPHKHRSSSRDSRDSKDERSVERKDRKSSTSSSSSKDKKSIKSDEKSHHHYHHHHHHKDPSRRESSGSSSSKEHSSKKLDSDRRRSSASSSSSSHKTEGSSHNSSHRKEEKKEEKRSERSNGGPNQIRINVRTALRDSLYARAKEAEDILLSSNEIKALALEIEEKLFDLFNDTGHKYRAKYRSLVFNIKDQKNKGLFRKILGGKISPDKLVLMSTEDLASKELAKWREQESKHQLEMIEKLEKEKQETKNTNHVTKKTHKGEIEVNDEDLSTLETRLDEKKEAEPDKIDELAQEPAIDTTNQHRAHLFDLNCKVCTGKIVPGPEEQTVPSVSLPAKSKKSGVVQFSLPEDEEEKEEKLEPRPSSSKKSEDKKEMEDEDYEKAAEIVKEALEHVHKAEEELSSLPSMVCASPKHHEPALSPPISPKEEPEDIDEDLEMERQSEVAALSPKVSGSSSTSVPLVNTSSSAAALSATEKKVVVRSPDSALQSGLEAKAKFTPTSPVLWKGFVSMLDVAKFFTSAYRVSGPVDHISIPDTVHIMGRISPDHMWDYLSKIRQAGSKDITVLRFIPGSDEEKVAYIHLYSYLNSRARCGVANNPSRQVKDFYIVPLASHSKIPRTLLPFDGPGLEENRPHMLIGILVRQRDKHSKDVAVDSDSPHSSSSHKSDKVGSSSAAAADGNSNSSKTRTPLTGVSRDPRLAKLAAKADSPKHGPSANNKGNNAETKPKEAQPSSDLDEYDPEYMPVLGKAKGSGSQPVAEYIPTSKKKDKDDQKSLAENKKGKSKTPSPEDSGGSDSKEKHQHHHHHHHHHHKTRHRHHHQPKEHDRNVAEDDSEPYSPSKEAEPYSPGMEAAAEEPYDPEDESLMDEEGHPLTSEKTASATVTVPTNVNATSVVTSKAAAGNGTSTTATAAPDDRKTAEDTANLTSEELVERMARSNDPSRISSLMVMALSQASTQHEQQQLLVKLTRQVEDRKLQLAEEMQRGSSLGQSNASIVNTQNGQKQQSKELTAVTSSEGGEEKNKDATSTVEQISSSSLSSLAPSNSSVKSHDEVSIKGLENNSDIKTEATSGGSSIPLTSSKTPSVAPTSMLAEKSGSTSGGGIKFSIKPLHKSPPKPVVQGNPFSTSSETAAQKTSKLTSSITPAVLELSPLTAPKSQAVSEKTSDLSRPQLPDALKALMNDVMGGTNVPSLENRSKMLINKEAEQAATIVEKKEEKDEENTKVIKSKEKENGDEVQQGNQEMAAAALEAQKRLEDEMEARRILDSLKKKAPTTSTAAETKAVEPASKPTAAPTIDELLDRLKKGGFQFPLQKNVDGTPVASSSPLPSVPSSSSTGESSSTSTPASSSSAASFSSSIIASSTPPLSTNPSVPTFTASKPLFSSGNMSPFSSAHPPATSSSSPLLASAQDVDLRIGIHPQQQPIPSGDSALSNPIGPVNRSSDRLVTTDICISPTAQDRDDRLLYHQDRDDRVIRSGAGPKHPLDPHAFPPLPGMYGAPRLPLPSGPDAPSYQPTPRSILPPKGRAQPPPPGTEFDKPAGVLGITDVDLRHPPLPPLPPQPPPPLPPLPHHQFREDVDYRNPDPYRAHHHGYNRGRGGPPYHRP